MAEIVFISVVSLFVCLAMYGDAGLALNQLNGPETKVSTTTGQNFTDHTPAHFRLQCLNDLSSSATQRTN